MNIHQALHLELKQNTNTNRHCFILLAGCQQSTAMGVLGIRVAIAT